MATLVEEQFSSAVAFVANIAITLIKLDGCTVEPRESELIGADLCLDFGEFGFSGKFGKILLTYRMQQSIDSGCSVKVYGKSTRLFARYSGKQVEDKKKISKFVSTL
ncbi:hypothetical protein AVEN_39883-1 [Araneus ventricosus]|uniref:Uncharacterized protein n=1 Tax=Araneus ventricosus TaxID=182803 RepID=A0A4Y2V8I2_ARAVE|nr:hypothetical protein AVEN_39883-1 [Araneus ventricosus]